MGIPKGHRAWLASLSLLLVAGCAGRGPIVRMGVFNRTKGVPVRYVFAEPRGTEKYPVLVFIDDEFCAPPQRKLPNERRDALVRAGFAVAIVERHGVRGSDDGSSCSIEFLSNNDRFERLSQVETILVHLEQVAPRWDGRLAFWAEGEGGAIAAEVAARHENTVAVVLLPGVGWERAKELLVLKKKEYLAQGVGPATIARELFQLDLRVSEMEQNPVTTKTWSDPAGTFRRWATYLRYAPIDDLVKVPCPIYIGHGTDDTVVPIESSEATELVFRRIGMKRLTFKRWEGLSHTWRDKLGVSSAVAVEADARQWLLATVPGRKSAK